MTLFQHVLEIRLNINISRIKKWKISLVLICRDCWLNLSTQSSYIYKSVQRKYIYLVLDW